MKRYSYGLLSILIIVCGLVIGKERSAENHRPASVGNNGSEYILHDSQQEQSPQERDPIILYFDDFEDDVLRQYNIGYGLIILGGIFVAMGI